ncbi:MAG: hypothetical protein ABI184_09780 [Ginsengibacter sp.]
MFFRFSAEQNFYDVLPARTDRRDYIPVETLIIPFKQLDIHIEEFIKFVLQQKKR